MKNVLLHSGDVAIVDDSDFEKVGDYAWYAFRRGFTTYARRVVYDSVHGSGHPLTVLMHRQVMGLTAGDKRVVDHINHNGLDNRRENLRLVSHRENAHNKRSKDSMSSRYIGVCWDKCANLWKSTIYVGNQKRSLGYFKDEDLAAVAYDNALVEMGLPPVNHKK